MKATDYTDGRDALRTKTKNCAETPCNPWSILRVIRGQSTIEYALLIAIALAAFLVMRFYLQRGVQANLKVVEERINAEKQ